MISRLADVKKKKAYARNLCGILDDPAGPDS
jgi:hypothetical protein